MGEMITQLLKVDFLATEYRLSNLNILRVACRKMMSKNKPLTIKKPYSIGFREKDGRA